MNINTLQVNYWNGFSRETNLIYSDLKLLMMQIMLHETYSIK